MTPAQAHGLIDTWVTEDLVSFEEMVLLEELAEVHPEYIDHIWEVVDRALEPHATAEDHRVELEYAIQLAQALYRAESIGFRVVAKTGAAGSSRRVGREFSVLSPAGAVIYTYSSSEDTQDEPDATRDFELSGWLANLLMSGQLKPLQPLYGTVIPVKYVG